MVQQSLEKFIEKTRKTWGPLTSEVVAGFKNALEELARDPQTTAWLPDALNECSGNTELYQDADHGFILTAYTESSGQYRLPHDHGSGWVVYAVQQGTLEMSTFARIVDQTGRLRLVNRERYQMTPGDCKVFLPLDIHNTRCISQTATILRLTSCDLKKEEREGRMIRFSSVLWRASLISEEVL